MASAAANGAALQLTAFTARMRNGPRHSSTERPQREREEARRRERQERGETARGRRGDRRERRGKRRRKSDESMTFWGGLPLEVPRQKRTGVLVRRRGEKTRGCEIHRLDLSEGKCGAAEGGSGNPGSGLGLIHRLKASCGHLQQIRLVSEGEISPEMWPQLL
ncbi:unnamed protein product [Pleuronectes platessa]|uniref:Uncharacterized protein n=1 Tax=Pleuronectes platessa TaxID=8262 RepID=A0A9N7TPN6_PLEPL|nr:unnamed protein product [Pleuronectes platessa]